MDKKYIIGIVVLVIIIVGAMFIVNNKINDDNKVNVNESVANSENGVSKVSESYKLVNVEDISLEVPEEVNLVEKSDDQYEKIYNEDVDYYEDSKLGYSILIFDDDKNIKQVLKNHLSTLNKDKNYDKIKDTDLNSSYHVFKQSTPDGDMYHIIFVIKEIDDDDKEFKLVEIIGKDLNQVKHSALTTKYVDV